MIKNQKKNDDINEEEEQISGVQSVGHSPGCVKELCVGWDNLWDYDQRLEILMLIANLRT